MQHHFWRLQCTVVHCGVSKGGNGHTEGWSLCIVSVLGREEQYTVKYTPLPETVLRVKPEGTPEGEGVYLTVYSELSPNTDRL